MGDGVVPKEVGQAIPNEIKPVLQNVNQQLGGSAVGGPIGAGVGAFSSPDQSTGRTLGEVGQGVQVGAAANALAGGGTPGGAAPGGTPSGAPVGGGMPAAIPEDPSVLASQGLTEGAPGVFSSPGTPGYLGPTGTPAGDPNQPQNAPGAGVVPQGAVLPPAPVATPLDGAAAVPPAPAAPASTGATPVASGTPVGGAGSYWDASGNPIPQPDPTGAVPPVDNPTTPSPAKPAAATPGYVGKALNAVSNNPLAAGAIGLTGYNMYAQHKARKEAERRADELSGPSRRAGESLLKQGQAGTIPPAIMQQFKTSYDNSVQEITQRYANMGRDAKTDSGAQAEMAKAKQSMDAMVAQYASQLTDQGLRALGVAAGPTQAAMTAGASSDAQLAQAMAQALNAGGQLYATSKQT